MNVDLGTVIGQIMFANGDCLNFTEAQEYLQAVHEELPYLATTGFQFKTLTNDPGIHKAVDDMIWDLYGEENPLQIEDYIRKTKLACKDKGGAF